MSDVYHSDVEDDDQILFVQERAKDNSTTLKKCRLKPSHSQIELYRKYWKVEKVKKLAIAQGVLSLLLFLGSLITSCTTRNPIEYIGFGIWAPINSVLGTAILLPACKKVTYARLHLVLFFEATACVCWLILTITEFSLGIPYRNNIGLKYTFDESIPIMQFVGFLMVIIMSVVGVVQLVIAFILALNSGRAMCQEISKVSVETLEEKIDAVKFDGDNNGAENVELDPTGKNCEKKVTGQAESPSVCTGKSQDEGFVTRL